MERVITAPLAVVRVNGIAIGKMRGIRVNESITRGTVQGLGRLTKDEVPPLAFSGTLTCDFYNIDFSKSQIPGANNREVQSVQEWVDNITLQEEGIEVALFKKVPKNNTTQGKREAEEKPYAIVRNLFLDAEGFDITEGSVSGRNQSFQYLDPIIFPK